MYCLSLHKILCSWAPLIPCASVGSERSSLCVPYSGQLPGEGPVWGVRWLVQWPQKPGEERIQEPAGHAGVSVHKLRSRAEQRMGQTVTVGPGWRLRAGWTGLRPQQVSGPQAKTFLGLEQGNLRTCSYEAASPDWLLLIEFSCPDH